MTSSTQRPRVAILGAGMIGAVHRRAALLAGAEIVGVLASTPERTAEAAAAWGVAPLSAPDALADLRPDVVHVCSPNGVHVAHTEAAVRARAHVICEKPLATTTAEAERLRALAREAGRVATVPFVYRFHPLVRELRARRLAGEFGRFHLLHGSYLQDWLLSPTATSWRVDPALGGASRAFADIGSHWCDLLEFVTGERLASVSAALTTTVPQRPLGSAATFGGGAEGPLGDVTTEDAAVVSFRTENGVLGSVTVSQVSAGRKNRLWIELDGEHGSAVFDQENPETVWVGGAESSHILQRDPGAGSADQRRLSSLPAGHPQGYAQCFENFVADTYRAAQGDPPDGLPTFDDGVRSARIVDAVLESAAVGRWVDIADET